MTKIRNHIVGAIPVLTLGLGFMVGRDYDNSSGIETQEAELSSSDGISPQGEKGTDFTVFYPSLEGNGKNIANETIKVLQDNQKSLEEKVLKYESENKTLKGELTKLKHTAGIYDFSDFKEPEDVKLEDRFAKSPVYYLGNFDKKYEDILSMVDIAIKAQKNIHDWHEDGKWPRTAMDFYNFGEMIILKNQGRSHQYTINIYLKDEMVTLDPFTNSESDDIDIGIAIDKAEVNVGNSVEEHFQVYLHSKMHNVQISYNATKMTGYEFISLGKLELPILDEQNKKFKSVPRSTTLANSIIEGIEV